MQKIYFMVMTHPGLSDITGIEWQSGKNMCQGGKPDTGKFTAYACVVDGMCATAAD